jgi:hypothetical protein
VPSGQERLVCLSLHNASWVNQRDQDEELQLFTECYTGLLNAAHLDFFQPEAQGILLGPVGGEFMTRWYSPAAFPKRPSLPGKSDPVNRRQRATPGVPAF